MANIFQERAAARQATQDPVSAPIAPPGAGVAANVPEAPAGAPVAPAAPAAPQNVFATRAAARGEDVPQNASSEPAATPGSIGTQALAATADFIPGTLTFAADSAERGRQMGLLPGMDIVGGMAEGMIDPLLRKYVPGFKGIDTTSGSAIRKGLTAAHINPEDYFPQPQNTPERMTRAGVSGALGMLTPGGQEMGLARLSKIAGELVAGGVGGIASEAVNESALPEEWKPLASGLAGIVAPGGVQIGAGAAKNAVKGAARRAGDFMAPTMARPGDVEGMTGRLAADKLHGIVTDRDTSLANLANKPHEIVPGSQPTGARVTEDTGLNSAEAAYARADPAFKDELLARNAENSRAQLAHLESIKPEGSASDVPAYFNARMQELETRAQHLYDQHEAVAAGAHDALGNPVANDVGQRARSSIEDEFRQLNKEANHLWNSIDPTGDMHVATDPLVKSAAKLYGQMGPEEALGLTEKEKQLAGVIGTYEGTLPFDRFKKLRTEITGAMRDAKVAGQNSAYGRLTQLRAAVEDAVGQSIGGKVAEEQSAVAAGTMNPADTLASKFVDKAKDYYGTQAREAGAGVAPGAEAGAAGAQPDGTAGASGAGGPEGFGPKFAQGDQGLPPNAPRGVGAPDDELFQAARTTPDVAPPNEADRISTRVPSLKNPPEDALTSDLKVGVDSMRANELAFAHNMQLVKSYPGVAIKSKNPVKIAREFIDNARANLRFIHDSIPEAVRGRSKLWYDGANKIANNWAKKHDLPVSSVAGAIAALSPQKDWFQNTSLAERVIDAHQRFKDDPSAIASPKMVETMDRIFSKPQYREAVERVASTPYRDLEMAAEKAMWIRAYDEAHNPRGFRTVSPEGDFVGPAKGKVAWGSLNEIGKAIISLESGGNRTIISSAMGGKHKVRNFYNNILAPKSKAGDVTIDTHAVAASLMRPLSGASAEVMHNFGTAPEQGKKPPGWVPSKAAAVSGSEGTYGLHAEAYREEAAALGILPRELQSITWEGVRGMFSAAFKRDKKAVAAIDDIWNRVKAGKLSPEEARNEIVRLAGGIENPDWYRPGAGADEAPSHSSYDGELAGAQLPGRAAARGVGDGEPATAGAAAGTREPAAAVEPLYQRTPTEGGQSATGQDRGAGVRPVPRTPEAAAGNGRGDLSKREADGSLVGLPRKPGSGIAASAYPDAQRVAADYMKKAGLPYDPPSTYQKVVPERAERIASAYDAMKHDPQNPEVKRSYAAMIDETLAQYQAMLDDGMKIEFIPEGAPDPYGGNPRNMTEDVRNNKHMWVFPTKDGFGSDAQFDPASNPLLADTQHQISGKTATANDIFRAVHDYFGHVKEGVGFRADGEENAWRAHSSMYSPEARRAMTSETRGQNSWVNYGPHGEANRTATSENTKYADQKTGLLPDWVVHDGSGDPGIAGTVAERVATAGRPVEEAKVIGTLVDQMYNGMAKAYGMPTDVLADIFPLPEFQKGGDGGTFYQSPIDTSAISDFQKGYSDDWLDKSKGEDDLKAVLKGYAALHDGDMSGFASKIANHEALWEKAYNYLQKHHEYDPSKGVGNQIIEKARELMGTPGTTKTPMVKAANSPELQYALDGIKDGQVGGDPKPGSVRYFVKHDLNLPPGSEEAAVQGMLRDALMENGGEMGGIANAVNGDIYKRALDHAEKVEGLTKDQVNQKYGGVAAYLVSRASEFAKKLGDFKNKPADPLMDAIAQLEKELNLSGKKSEANPTEKPPSSEMLKDLHKLSTEIGGVSKATSLKQLTQILFESGDKYDDVLDFVKKHKLEGEWDNNSAFPSADLVARKLIEWGKVPALDPLASLTGAKKDPLAGVDKELADGVLIPKGQWESESAVSPTNKLLNNFLDDSDMDPQSQGGKVKGMLTQVLADMGPGQHSPSAIAMMVDNDQLLYKDTKKIIEGINPGIDWDSVSPGEALVEQAVKFQKYTDGVKAEQAGGSFNSGNIKTPPKPTYSYDAVDTDGPSGGRPYTPIDTPAFEEWFGDSKAVDRNGNPVVVNHGTKQGGFRSFREQNNFFAADKATSRHFAAGSEAAIIPTDPEILIKNPKDAKRLFGDDSFKLTKHPATRPGEQASYTVSYKNKFSDTTNYKELGSREATMRVLDDYLGHREGGQYGIYETYLSLQKPYEFDYEGNNWSEAPHGEHDNYGEDYQPESTEYEAYFDGDHMETFDSYSAAQDKVDELMAEARADAEAEARSNMQDKFEIKAPTPLLGDDTYLVRQFDENGHVVDEQNYDHLADVQAHIEDAIASEARDAGDNRVEQLENNGSHVNEHEVPSSGQENWATDDIANWAKENGYDGVIFRNIRDDGPKTDVYIAFKPEQIKSVHNRGTWNGNDKRLLFQSGYHASPHIFDKFILGPHTIKTGEGNLDFGHGLYFSTHDKARSYYRATVAGPEGREYHVDLPETKELLDWHNEFSSMDKGVRAKVNDLMRENGLRTPAGDATGADIYHSLSRKLGGDAAASEALKNAGIPGHRYLSGQLSGIPKHLAADNFVIYDHDRIKMIGSTPVGDMGQPGKRGSIQFGADNGSIISLFKSADTSTALHELGHHFLQMYRSMAEHPGAPPQLAADWAAVKDWWGKNSAAVAKDAGGGVTASDVRQVLKNGTTGNDALDFAINRGFHEQWARGFERYLRDGVAPTKALQAAFDKFKSWLTSVYQSVAGLNVELSPEMKGVFDRMLGGGEEAAPGKASSTPENRPASARSAPEAPEAPPRMLDASAKAKFDAATNATRNIKETYGAPPVKAMMKRPGNTLPYDMSNEGVASNLWKKGPTGSANIKAVLKAAGDRAEARQSIEDAAVMSLKRDASKNGIIDPAKLATWRANHADALTQVPNLDRRLQEAGQASKVLADISARRIRAIDAVNKTAIGKVLKLTNENDVNSHIGSLINGKGGVQAMRELVGEARRNPAAMAGLQRAVVDHMLTKLRTPKDTIRNDTFQRYLGKIAPAISEVLEPDQMSALRALAQDLKRANKDYRAPGGGSPTVEYLNADKRYVEKSPTLLRKIVQYVAQSSVGAAVGSSTAFLVHPFVGIASGLASLIGAHLVQTAREAGIKNVEDMVKQAILHPDLMEALLMKAPKKADTGSSITAAQRLGRLSLFGGMMAGRTEQQQDEKKKAAAPAPANQNAATGVVPGRKYGGVV